jgi:hypothetical protein
MVVEKSKEFKEFKEFKERSQEPGGGSRGALPRLRGRGEQGDIITHAVPLSTLCIA